jgi:amino acid adenylation domain-containing protein
VSKSEPDVTNRRSGLSEAKRALLEARLRGGAPKSPTGIPRRSQAGPARLSFAQERLWLIEQLEPGNTAYNISRVFRCKALLDEHALNQALNEIIARHESLRTSFAQIDGQALQVIAPEIVVSLRVEDLTESPNHADELKRIANEEARRSFDLSQAPLFRVRLLRLGEHDHALLLSMHHIISDLWSLQIFHRELSALYEAHASGQQPGLPLLVEPPVQYADYAAWQRHQFEQDKGSRTVEYWRQQLANAPKTLSLPTDKQRPLRLSFRGGFETRSLSKELRQKLNALARQENVSLFMIVLAAFNVLLHRYSNQEDILVGVPMTGRNRLETESLIGFFVNTVVLRSDLSGEPSFRELVKRTRQMTLAAYQNQDLPFERLVQALQPSRGIGHSPFFQVMLDVQSAGSAATNNWQVDEVEIDRGGSRADLLLFVTEKSDSLDCWLEYSSDLFEPETAARMLGHFEAVLAGIVENPDRNISEIELLTAAEREQLQQRHAVQNYPANQTLVELLEQQIERSPDAIALTFANEQLTYRELDQRANQLANHLLQVGVTSGELVPLCLERSIDLVVGILAVLKTGAAYLPLDPTYPADRLNFMIADSGARVLLTQTEHKDKFRNKQVSVVCLDEERQAIDAAGHAGPRGNTSPQDLAYVIYTSGSTGSPKGVCVTHANVVRLFSSTEQSFHFNQDDVWTLFHSYAFDFSVWELWGALLYGGRLVIVPYWISREPKEFHRLLRQEKVTVLNQTPSAFRQLIQADTAAQDDELNLRLVIFGGEALELSSLRPWWERHDETRPQLVNMYGITETTVHVTYRPLTKADLTEGRSVIGAALGDLQVYVLDRKQRLAPLGVPGEMYVGGAGLSRGYLNRRELTAERFIPHPFSSTPGERLYRTGDVARYLPNFDLEYLGRSDRQVKVRGFRIELGEIEAVLGQLENVQECVVLPFVEETGDQQLTAYIVSNGAGELDRELLRAYLRERLPAHMVPAYFVALSEFPLTPNGKLDREALPAPEKSRGDGAKAFVAPRTDAEVRLAKMWSEVLGRKEIGIHDNFFDLGGHSLLAAQIVARVSSAFGVKLPLRNFFDQPTVAALAVFVSESAQQLPDQAATIKRLPRQ